MKGFCDGHINGWSSELAGPVFKGGIRDDIVVSNPETPISEYTLYHIRDPYYHLRYTPQLRDMGVSGNEADVDSSCRVGALLVSVWVRGFLDLRTRTGSASYGFGLLSKPCKLL